MNLRKRRARNREESDVPRVQVRNGAVKMIRKEGTARATFDPVRAEHKVVDEQLAAAGEEIGERFFSGWPVENIFLPDFFPRKLAALFAKFVAQARQLFFLL